MERRRISTHPSVMVGFKECLESSLFLKAFRMPIGFVEEQSVLVHEFILVSGAQLYVLILLDQCILSSGFRGDKMDL